MHINIKVCSHQTNAKAKLKYFKILCVALLGLNTKVERISLILTKATSLSFGVNTALRRNKCTDSLVKKCYRGLSVATISTTANRFHQVDSEFNPISDHNNTKGNIINQQCC